MTAAEASVRIFIDYQNMHLSVTEAFAPPGTSHKDTLLHPGRLADAVMTRRAVKGRGGRLDAVHVYRGQPSPQHQLEAASRNKAQAAHWSRDPRVVMHTRPLRYPHDWPDKPAKEKGVDVMLACDLVRCALQDDVDTIILASRDTDLVPALEMARDLGTCDIVEVVTWQNSSRLRFPDKSSLWCTYLEGEDYLAAKDPRRYD